MYLNMIPDKPNENILKRENVPIYWVFTHDIKISCTKVFPLHICHRRAICMRCIMTDRSIWKHWVASGSWTEFPRGTAFFVTLICKGSNRTSFWIEGHLVAILHFEHHQSWSGPRTAKLVSASVEQVIRVTRHGLSLLWKAPAFPRSLNGQKNMTNLRRRWGTWKKGVIKHPNIGWWCIPEEGSLKCDRLTYHASLPSNICWECPLLLAGSTWLHLRLLQVQRQVESIVDGLDWSLDT